MGHLGWSTDWEWLNGSPNRFEVDSRLIQEENPSLDQPSAPEPMLTDLRQALRQFRHNKGFTSATLVTLALCIGATTAIFSTVYSLMLKPLPFNEPKQIVELYTSAAKAGLNKMPANIPFYVDYTANATSYEAIGLWSFSEQMVGEEASVTRLAMATATAEIFQILRVQPLMGSFFTKEQNQPGADKVVVLTQSYWQTQYAEDPAILGKEILIAGDTYKVIGVAPRKFEAWDARVKLVYPMSWPAAAENPRGRYGVNTQLFGRLKPGVAAGQADATALEWEQAGNLSRFIEVNYAGEATEQRWRERYAGARVVARPMALREIFIVLARSGRKSMEGVAA